MFNLDWFRCLLAKNVHFPILKSKEFSVGFVEVDIDRGVHWIWRDDFQQKGRQKPALRFFVRV